MSSEHILLGDIGGTTARFAILSAGLLGPIVRAETAKYAGIADAVAAFLDGSADRLRPTAAVLGVAGPVEAERCVITNSHWTVDGKALRARFAFTALSFVNDFEAMAWALPCLKVEHVKPLGRGRPVTGEPMVVIGPGTGLGMAALISDPAAATVIATEGGHATLPSNSAREDAIITRLRAQFDHVSAERVLSGPGLENLYQAIAAIDRAVVPIRTAAEITTHALERSCAVCRDAVDVFCAMLGTVAGNLALTFRARGGVFLAGGIAPRLVNCLPHSEFRSRFEAKGRFRAYLQNVPTSLIVREDAVFLGLQSLAERLALR